MTTITQPCPTQRAYRPRGLDRIVVRFGLKLAVWASARARLREIRGAHYRDLTLRYEQVRDRMHRTGLGPL